MFMAKVNQLLLQLAEDLVEYLDRLFLGLMGGPEVHGFRGGLQAMLVFVVELGSESVAELQRTMVCSRFECQLDEVKSYRCGNEWISSLGGCSWCEKRSAQLLMAGEHIYT